MCGGHGPPSCKEGSPEVAPTAIFTNFYVILAVSRKSAPLKQTGIPKVDAPPPFLAPMQPPLIQNPSYATEYRDVPDSNFMQISLDFWIFWTCKMEYMCRFKEKA